jgi:hypothetical protein
MDRTPLPSLDPAAWSAPSAVRRWRGTALAVGLVAAAACLAGWFLDRDQMLRSYLVGWLLWLGVALGSLSLAMIHHLTGGAWGLVIRRQLEAATRTLPLLALLSLPLLAGLPAIFLWARPEAVAHDHALHHKAPYLNVPFFVGRTVAMFAIFGLLAFLLSRWSRRQDEGGGAELGARMRAASGLGLVLMVLVGTLVSVDWLMSLDPYWYSSLYGVLFIAGQALSALVVAIVVTWLLAGHAPMSAAVTKRHFHDYGKLLLAFVMFWTYLAISQYIIMWQANLPEEAVWFQHRTHGGWQWVALAIVLFHFLFPFLLLLSRSLKQRMPALAGVALLLLFMRWVDLHWQAAPTFSPDRLSLHWLDLAAPVAVGGLWLAWFFHELAKRPLLPVNDPHIEEALGHG